MRGWLILFLVFILFFLPIFGLAQPPPVERGVNVSVTIEEVTPPQLPGVGIPLSPLTATAVFKGKAYPDAFITILKDGRVTATLKAERTGFFSKTLTGLVPKLYTFGIWAEDIKERRSLTLKFSVSLVGGTITTIDLFLPPTLELDSFQVEQGKDLEITGSAFPSSLVHIFFYPSALTLRTSADKTGNWKLKYNTAFLSLGTYAVKVKSQTTDGKQSLFSETKAFKVVKRKIIRCPKGDLNRDGRVDIVDFSILMYWWGRYDPCADQNADGIVNLIDLSILLYYWTG